MSYSAKHEPKAEGSANTKAPMDSKKKQKIGIIAVLCGLAVIVIVALVIIINGGKNGNNNQASPLYPDGVYPTSGTKHGQNLIPGGGKDVSEVTGLWSLDGATKYRFDGTGRGIMYTPSKKNFTFAYSAENGVLLIDFDDDLGEDPRYEYTCEGDTLTLTRGSNTYNCTREIE